MGKKNQTLILRVLLMINLGLLPIVLFRKSSIKDWLLVYLFSALSNGIIDKFLYKYKLLTYPIRLFPEIFKINILFDFFVYPLSMVLYNQITEKDKPFAIFYKVLYFVFPIFFFELWAVQKTKLIKWGKGWKWYFSFVSLIIVSLCSRLLTGTIRKLDEKW